MGPLCAWVSTSLPEYAESLPSSGICPFCPALWGHSGNKCGWCQDLRVQSTETLTLHRTNPATGARCQREKGTRRRDLCTRICQNTGIGCRRKKHMLRSKEDSRRERSGNFQSFVRMALETLLGSCRRKRGTHHTSTEHVQTSKTFMSWHRHSLPVRPFLLVRADRGVRV
ncbi:uncharacterized protein LOC143805181 isoform X1 [Ranitomeya variabilis]|uniref:uncharacterized protein LOC143805181 isoform X1 n=1 Tax=Ranitomeya variabilis TaxID=490064 RepID=UPI0040560ADE